MILSAKYPFYSSPTACNQRQEVASSPLRIANAEDSKEDEQLNCLMSTTLACLRPIMYGGRLDQFYPKTQEYRNYEAPGGEFSSQLQIDKVMEWAEESEANPRQLQRWLCPQICNRPSAMERRSACWNHASLMTSLLDDRSCMVLGRNKIGCGA